MKKLTIAFILFLSYNAIGQNQQFYSEIDTNRILIGEQINLQIHAHLPKGSKFKWPVFPDTISALEIINAQSPDTVSENDIWKITQNITLTSFDSGYYAIPPLTLIYKGNPIVSKAIAFEVKFPEVEKETDYYDIKEPLEVEINLILIILLIVGVLFLIALIIFIVRYFKKENKRKFDAQQVRLSPAQYALKQLDKLENEKLWENGRLKEFYSKLIDILRFYLHRRFRIAAMESTAEELIIQIKELKLNENLFNEVRRVLLTGAMVKYAREKPGPEENENAIPTVRRFIEETRQVTPENNELHA